MRVHHVVLDKGNVDSKSCTLCLFIFSYLCHNLITNNDLLIYSHWLCQITKWFLAGSTYTTDLSFQAWDWKLMHSEVCNIREMFFDKFIIITWFSDSLAVNYQLCSAGLLVDRICSYHPGEQNYVEFLRFIITVWVAKMTGKLQPIG